MKGQNIYIVCILAISFSLGGFGLYEFLSSSNSNLGITDLIAGKIPDGSSVVFSEYYGPHQNANTKLTGIVTYTFRHADNSIYKIVKSHNTKTVQGTQCGMFVLYAINNGAKVTANSTADACQGMNLRSTASYNGFNVFGLMNRSSNTANLLNGSDTPTTTKIGGSRASSLSGLILTATANEGGPQRSTQANIVFGTTSATWNQVTITSPAFTFTNLKAAGTIITGAFLMNNTSSTDTLDNAYAENSMTGVTVLPVDTLTLTWQITWS